MKTSTNIFRLLIFAFSILLSPFSIFNSAYSQNYEWAKSIGSPHFDDHGTSIAIDAQGNVFLTGIFGYTADFDPGTANSNLTSAGSHDVFLAKYNNSGNYIWAKSIGGLGNDHVYSIALDKTGNIFITGTFEKTADFDPSIATANLISASNADVFIAKYDSIGNYIWAKSFGDLESNSRQSITLDTLGNVYLSGNFGGNVDFEPSSSKANLSSAGGQDMFFAKYDSNGNYLWAKSIGGTGKDYINSMAIDAFGNLYLVGAFSDTADFDPSSNVANLFSESKKDLFFSKYDNDGNYLWAKSAANIGANSIVVDASGNVYIAGTFNGTCDFDPGPAFANLNSTGNSNIFFAKYNTNGNYIWSKSITNLNGGGGGIRIGLDASGSIYIASQYMGIADFDPGNAVANLTSVGSFDLFFSKYDNNGNYLWAKSIGGSSEDCVFSLTLDVVGNLYITGSFWQTVDFDPSTPNVNLTAAGFCDIFFAKYTK